MNEQSESLVAQLLNSDEHALGVTISDIENTPTNRFCSDVRALPLKFRRMIAMMVMCFYKIIPLPASAMVKVFDDLERGGITLDMYNEATYEYNLACKNAK